MRTLLALIVLMPLLDGLYTPDHFWYYQLKEAQPRVVVMEEIKEVRLTDEPKDIPVRPQRYEPIHITCGEFDCTSRGGGR